MKNNLNKRDWQLDRVKGIGIILVVVGHSGAPFESYIYLFHMPIFFIVAGYTYKEMYSDTIVGIGQLIKKRMKSLYIPYLIWNITYLIFHNFLLNLQIYTNNPLFLELENGNSYGLEEYYSLRRFLIQLLKIFLFNGSEQLAGAAWYLEALFGTTILFAICDFCLKKIKKEKIDILRIGMSIVFLLIGFTFHINDILLPAHIGTMFSSVILFVSGIYLKKYKVYIENKINCQYKRWGIVIICAVGLAILSHYGRIGLGSNTYPNPLFLLASSYLGWGLIWELGALLKLKVLVKIGQNTLGILFLHFLSFKIVTYISILAYGYPQYVLATFPIYIEEWWGLYTVVGILGSLVIYALIKKCQIILMKYIKR